MNIVIVPKRIAKKLQPGQRYYMVHQARGAKVDRFSVFETTQRRTVMGGLERHAATLLCLLLNGKEPQAQPKLETERLFLVKMRALASRLAKYQRQTFSIQRKPKLTKKRSDKFIYGKYGRILDVKSQ